MERRIMNLNETLGDALPKEITRVRDVVLPEYLAVGPAGAFGAIMIQRDLDAATKAMINGDLVAMIRCYQALKEIRG